MQPGDSVQVGTTHGLLEEWDEGKVTLRVFEQYRREYYATNRLVTVEGSPEPLELYFKPPRGKKFCKRTRINGIYEEFEWESTQDLWDQVRVEWVEPEPESESEPEPEEVLAEEPMDAKEDLDISELPETPSRRTSRRLAAQNVQVNMAPRSLFGEAESESSEPELEVSSSEDDEELDDKPRSGPDPEQPPTPRTPRRRKAGPSTTTPKKAMTPRHQRRTNKRLNEKAETPRKKRHATSLHDADRHRSLPGTPHKEVPTTPQNKARNALHMSQAPEQMPCREQQFSSLFNHLEQAIKTETGTCIYVSGVPGTGKSSTVREVMEQLTIRQQDGEYDFEFIEVNGLRLARPEHAYEQLYEVVVGGDHIATKDAMRRLEAAFNDKKNSRTPLVVVMDELDQLVTKDQNVIYNFFNWPSLSHSKLVVIAIANTLDLPERMLQNKIKSRLGLTRIQFPGYTHTELQTILDIRLEETSGIVLPDAIEYIARKVSGVSGDARRALDICRRAIEVTPEGEPTTIEHVQQAFSDAQPLAVPRVLSSLGLGSKLFYLAMCQYSRRYPKQGQYKIVEVLQQIRELFINNPALERFDDVFFPNNCVRMRGYQYALAELIECGIIAQDNVIGEATCKVNFALDMDLAREAMSTEDLVNILEGK